MFRFEVGAGTAVGAGFLGGFVGESFGGRGWVGRVGVRHERLL